MKYRRPQDFETAVDLLAALSKFKVDGKRKELKDAISRLFEIHWFDNAMKPMYHANAVVRLVMNSLVPMIQEVILEERILQEHERNADSKRAEKYKLEYEDLRNTLLRVAPTREHRTVTPEFEAMAVAMEMYAKDEIVQSAICNLFCLIKTARVALRLVFRRINDSLEKDCEIVKSDDIPLEALQL